MSHAASTLPARVEPIGWPARVVAWGGDAFALACLWCVYGLLREIAFLRRGDEVDLADRGSDFFFLTAITTVGWVGIPASLLLAVWLYRAWSNVAARALAHSGAPMRAARAWWWFVPGANLVLPLHVLATIWRNSAASEEERRPPLRIWIWGVGQVLVALALVFTLVGQPSIEDAWFCPVPGEFRADCVLTEAGRDAWIETNTIFTATLATQALLVGVLLTLIPRINRMQDALVEAYTSESRDELWETLRDER